MRRALLVLVLAACGSKQPAPRAAPPDAGTTAQAPDAGTTEDPPPLAEDLPALAERTVAMMTALADALEGTGDCAALAASVRAVLDEHREARVASAAAVDRGDGRALDAALEVHADAIAAAARRMKPAIARCGSDAAFAEALTPLDTP